MFSAPSLLDDLWALVDSLGGVGQFRNPKMYYLLLSKADRDPFKKIQDSYTTDISGSSPGSGTSAFGGA
jgi:hypothetical protein